MPTFLLYSLKAAGCLAVFYLFYKLLLSRDTLHRMNRVLLCGVLLLSFLLPLCVITVEKELPGVSAAGIDVIPENYFRRDMVFENRIPDDTRDLMITEEPEPLPNRSTGAFCSESSILQGYLRRWDGPYATSCGLCE